MGGGTEKRDGEGDRAGGQEGRRARRRDGEGDRGGRQEERKAGRRQGRGRANGRPRTPRADRKGGGREGTGPGSANGIPAARPSAGPHPPRKFLMTSFLEPPGLAAAAAEAEAEAAAAASAAGLVRPLVCPTSAEKLPFRGGSSAMAPRGAPPGRPRCPAAPAAARPTAAAPAPATPTATATAAPTATPTPTATATPRLASVAAAGRAESATQQKGRRRASPVGSGGPSAQGRGRGVLAEGRRGMAAGPQPSSAGARRHAGRGSRSRGRSLSGTDVRGRRGRGAWDGPPAGSDAWLGAQAPSGTGGGGCYGAHHHQPVPAAGRGRAARRAPGRALLLLSGLRGLRAGVGTAGPRQSARRLCLSPGRRRAAGRGKRQPPGCRGAALRGVRSTSGSLTARRPPLGAGLGHCWPELGQDVGFCFGRTLVGVGDGASEQSRAPRRSSRVDARCWPLGVSQGLRRYRLSAAEAWFRHCLWIQSAHSSR